MFSTSKRRLTSPAFSDMAIDEIVSEIETNSLSGSVHIRECFASEASCSFSSILEIAVDEKAKVETCLKFVVSRVTGHLVFCQVFTCPVTAFIDHW
jgi:hypothetical protein